MASDEILSVSPDRPDSLMRVRDSLLEPAVFDFLSEFVPKFYASVVLGHEAEARLLALQSLNLLREAADSGHPAVELAEAAIVIHRDIFHESDADFWFTPVHTEYNVVGKPSIVAPFVAERLRGTSVLDIGGGSGHMASRLNKIGYNAALTDVLDYRAPQALGVPFEQMTSTVELPYEKDQFGSSILFEVLHHVNEEEHIPLLREAARVSPRIVVIEDVYGSVDHPLLMVDEDKQDPEPSQAYLSMTPAEQLRTLTLMDFFVNIASKGIIEMNIPFDFKSIRQWEEVFKEAGLAMSAATQVGFFKNTLNRNFQVYFELDRQ